MLFTTWNERLGVVRDLLEHMQEGNTMHMFKTRTVGPVAVATAFSMGLAASAVSVASASTHSTHLSSHHSVAARTLVMHGVATAASSSSITVLNAKDKSMTFAIVTTTKILGGLSRTTLLNVVLGDLIKVRELV
jgi:hypothetical protein